jgi:ankyrin repeat/BTB/POZ domain-containing protein 1
MDENGGINADAAQSIANASSVTDEAIDMTSSPPNTAPTEAKALDPTLDPFMNGEIRTLDGEIAGDEFAADAINYQILLGKIDTLLERLKLDA